MSTMHECINANITYIKKVCDKRASYLPFSTSIPFRTLSDIDNDGKLTSDEFVVAMHLVDMARSGQNLPMTLPAEMVPPSFRRGRSSSFSAGAAVGLPPANIMSNVMQQPPPSPGGMAPPMSPSMLPKQESVDEPLEDIRLPGENRLINALDFTIKE